MSEELVTEVWRLKGATGSTPGLMRHDGGLVTLELESGDASKQTFQVSLSEITEVKWPALQFSGGCNFVVAGEKYRLSFLRPQNTRIGIYGDVAGVASISGGRKAGKAWKALLGG